MTTHLRLYIADNSYRKYVLKRSSHGFLLKIANWVFRTAHEYMNSMSINLKISDF